MDSLTQIVLGAAVGEAALGRRVGNRALLWGGIAGTLPDLDVLANAVTDPVSALAYHRAFTHSISFAVLAAPIIGLAVHRLYGGQTGRPPLGNRWVYPLAVLAFFLLLAGGSALMPIEVYRIPQIAGLITLVFAAICGLLALRHAYRRRPSTNENASFTQWTGLFFLAIVTHPLLDCFTTYGTQLFQPLATSRLSWNTISVADPLYTLPFLILLVAAGRRRRGTARRRWLNRAGLVISSAYLALTVVNHFNVRAVMRGTLEQRAIAAERYTVGPTILNNILWSGTARAGTDYYVGQYSLLDRERAFGPFVRVPANHDWVAPYREDRDLRILEWFTQGYYGVVARDSGMLQISDLRFGLIGDDPADPASYIFSWQVDTSQHPVRVVREFAGPQRDGAELVGDLWERLRGR